ncbi:FAD-dependent monooxygenase [Streptomyces sp. HC44]|uniref:FAD-dependent monooxygenase n=1 Tax=Streptomyces scabichelini TaxID=2711217 RepID=A0A6G4V2N6_9ACTN|nr:NAD(P)/FAD-dependent oxidoreductase [Streptomyces scabichelini]NGO08266.1 FAD-dependent monooxygenase [Streptomyces scabichelini]
MVHVLVLGAGPTGLMTAMMLATDGHRVTVLDRDPSPPKGGPSEIWSDWKRPGVHQFSQGHLLMPGGFQLLAAELPTVVERLIDLGGSRYNIISGAWGVKEIGGPQPGDDRFDTVAARRPVLEAALLAEAMGTAGITVRRGSRVTGLLVGNPRSAGRPHVTGVLVQGGERVEADLVVDAAGRHSQVAAMLADIGAAPHEERVERGFRYYTRFFRSADGTLPPPRPWLVYHHESVSVISFPGDSGTWAVWMVTSGRDQELRGLGNEDAWQRAARLLFATEARWVEGEPITGVRAMGGMGSTYRRFVVDDLPVATGILTAGDAWATINPAFGTGMTMGFRHAALLRDTLRMVGTDDPVELAVRFDAATEEQLTPVWKRIAAWDRHRLAEIDAEIRGEGYTTDDPAWHQNLAVHTASRKDPDILRGLTDVGSLLATPEEALAKPHLMEKIADLGVGASRYPDPGPTRRELLAARAND